MEPAGVIAQRCEQHEVLRLRYPLGDVGVDRLSYSINRDGLILDRVHAGEELA